MSSHTHGYNEELHDWERITSASNKLNTQDLVAHTKLDNIANNIGSNSTSIMKACTDISDTATAVNLLTDATGHLQVDINNFPTSQTVAGSVSVSGSVNVDNFPTSFEVSNFPTSQTVAGSVTVNTISGFNLETTQQLINGKISQGEGDVAGGGDGLQQILCYGKDQSGNLDPLNVDSNGHLKITLNDIEANITNSINVVPTKEAVVDTQGTTTSLRTQMVANSKAGSGGADVLTLTCNGINLTNDFVALHTQTPRQSINDANSSVNAGAYFDVVDVGQAKNFNAFFLTGNSSGLSGSFVLEGSADNTNWIPVYDIYEQSHGGSTTAIFEATNITYGFQYYRVRNNTTATITLTTGVYNYFN